MAKRKNIPKSPARKAQPLSEAANATEKLPQGLSGSALAECIRDLFAANASLLVIQTALTGQGCDADNSCAALIDDYTWKKIEGVINRLQAWRDQLPQVQS